jgi:hypothetical protein
MQKTPTMMLPREQSVAMTHAKRPPCSMLGTAKKLTVALQRLNGQLKKPYAQDLRQQHCGLLMWQRVSYMIPFTQRSQTHNEKEIRIFLYQMLDVRIPGLLNIVQTTTIRPSSFHMGKVCARNAEEEDRHNGRSH